MLQRLDHLDQRLLDEFQRDFPLVTRPFMAIASALEVSEDVVIGRLKALQAAGAIARIGATVHPNTVGASTLAALAVPEARLAEVAALLDAERGVNHCYLREDDWNLWFVVTAPDAARLSRMLRRIEDATGLPVLDLPLLRPFNIDLGFRLSGMTAAPMPREAADLSAIAGGDSEIVQMMTDGLALVPRPYRAAAAQLGRPESSIIGRLNALLSAGILNRIGVVVRHRAIGWRANAMVAWNIPDERMEAAGRALARHAGVSLCYQRRTVPGVWPYGLFIMIHARSRSEALDVLDGVRAMPELAGADCRVLFSTRCFKQTGALVHAGAAA
jgi:DNA-binding Lrp family transcriptional regulator